MFALSTTFVRSILIVTCICVANIVLLTGCETSRDSVVLTESEGGDAGGPTSDLNPTSPDDDGKDKPADSAVVPVTLAEEPQEPAPSTPDATAAEATEKSAPVVPEPEEPVAISPKASADPEPVNPDVASADQPDLPVDPAWKPLTENGIVWLDMQQKSVVVSAKICLREGPLEMFACTPGTKEYESLAVVDCPAFMVHSALLAIGAKAGSPVSFNPYKAASGSVVDVFIDWLDDQGVKQRVKAQDWIRHEETGKPMPHDFVFGGSSFWTDDDGGQQYSAEGGELICVSNFSTAMMDLPVASPQANQGLWFSAFTEKIPKLGTKIHLILIPRPK